MSSLLGTLARPAPDGGPDGGPRNRTPVPYTTTHGIDPTGLLGNTDRDSQLGAMGAVGTLFSVVDAITSAVSRVEWTLYRKAKSGRDEDRTAVESHACVDLWNKPNDHYSRKQLVTASEQHYQLTGEAPILISRHPLMRSLPLELWPMRPDRIDPVPDPEAFLSGYQYRSPDGQKIPLGLDEVLRMLRPHPKDPYRGLGAVQTILIELDASRMTAEWNRNFFRNSAVPGGVVEYDEELTDTEFETALRRWREQHQGVSNAHRVAMIEKGRWRDRQFSLRDMQFVELRGVGRDTVLEVFRVHKATLGITEDVNRAASLAADSQFMSKIVIPRLDDWKELLNTRLLPMYGPTATGLEWDYDDPTPPDPEAADRERTSKAAAYATLVRAGVEPDDAAAAVGLPRMRTVVKAAPEPAPGGGEQGGTKAREVSLVEAVQKVYLGVGTVLTWEEARAILNQWGADLDLSVPSPNAAPEPAPAGQPPAARVRNRSHVVAAADFPTPPDGVPAEDPDAVDAVDLSPVQAAWEAALAGLLATWSTSVVVDWISDLVQQIRVALRGDSTLTGLRVNTSDAVDLVADALTDHAITAADHAADEGSDDDITLSPTTPARADLEDVATLTVNLLGRGLELSAASEAHRLSGPGADPGDVADMVREHLQALSDAEPERQLGAALTAAQNAARVRTFGSGPVTALYASEQMDTNTCGPCRAVHGRWVANTDDLRPLHQLYPTAGYADCEGRWRCRGTVVAVRRPGRKDDTE